MHTSQDGSNIELSQEQIKYGIISCIINVSPYPENGGGCCATSNENYSPKAHRANNGLKLCKEHANSEHNDVRDCKRCPLLIHCSYIAKLLIMITV